MRLSWSSLIRPSLFLCFFLCACYEDDGSEREREIGGGLFL